MLCFCCVTHIRFREIRRSPHCRRPGTRTGRSPALSISRLRVALLATGRPPTSAVDTTRALRRAQFEAESKQTPRRGLVNKREADMSGSESACYRRRAFVKRRAVCCFPGITACLLSSRGYYSKHARSTKALARRRSKQRFIFIRRSMRRLPPLLRCSAAELECSRA